MDLIGLLIFLVIVALVFWVLGQFSGTIPAPILKVVYVVLVVICVLYLLQMLTGWSGGPTLRIR